MGLVDNLFQGRRRPGAMGVVLVAALTLAMAATWPRAVVAQTPVAFEVASVKKSRSGQFAISPYGGNQFSVNSASLTLLICVAFGVSDADLVGGPEWRDSEYYDVVGKAEDGVVLTAEQVRPRLLQLLTERFRLVTHREPRRVPGYSLVVSKDGAKLKTTGAEAAAMAAIIPGGVRVPSASMDSFAAILSRVVGRPVVNETALDGNYRFELDFAEDAAVSTDRPSVFTVLQEQLGLRLESRTVDVEKIVIDGVERPSEN